MPPLLNIPPPDVIRQQIAMRREEIAALKQLFKVAKAHAAVAPMPRLERQEAKGGRDAEGR